MTDQYDEMKYLYRFRSTEALLGEFKELERQEIYFATPEQLNDPVEGFRDLFWLGDEIVWRNLFKHYLMCLSHTCALAIIKPADQSLTNNDIPVFKSERDLNTPTSLQIFNEVCDNFFSHKEIELLPQSLAQLERSIRRDELGFYLSDIHCLALYTIADTCQKHNIAIFHDTDYFKDKFLAKETTWPKVIDSLQAVDGLPFPSDELAEFSFQFLGAQDYIGDDDIQASSVTDNIMLRQLFLFSDFTSAYIQQIEKLVYSDWYTACFMNKPENSAMWGHYADRHRGVCLKFRTKTKDGNSSISLTGLNGNNSLQGHTISLPFQQVTYQATYPEIDFFKSLGRLPEAAIRQDWLLDRDGNESSCAFDIFHNREKWRDEYWQDFTRSITTKTDDWEYENEHRLILTNTLNNYEDAAHRKLTYRLDDLDGIIFGIKTSESDKRAIHKIIKAKCQHEGRTKFSFFQAQYSRLDGSIKFIPLSLFSSFAQS